MVENQAADEGRVRTYLAQHGGAVEDAAGRGLTDEMARGIGVERAAALSALLAEMETQGVITREMRGLRTYRIALVDGADSPPGPTAARPTAAPVPASAGGAGARAGAGAGAGAGAVSLRDTVTRSMPRGYAQGEGTNGDEAPTVSLRQAITATQPTSEGKPNAWAPPPTSFPPPPPPSPPPTPAIDTSRPARPVSRGPRSRSPLASFAPPSRGPSTPLVTAVVVSIAGLVLITVITVIAVTGSNHHVPAIGTVSSSADACRVVGTADASVALGDDAGAPHYVLGSCVYDDGHRELIVDVARSGGRQAFDGSHNATAKDVPGLGDGAYYDGGTLRVLKGSSLMLLTINPYSPDAPSPKLLALATTATARL